MIGIGVRFGGHIALALHGDDVQNLRPFILLGAAENADKRFEVVPNQGADVKMCIRDRDYSSLYEEDTAERERILHALLESVGEGTFMLGPIHFHYGCHTRIGSHCFMNFNFTVQDDARVTIGDHCNFCLLYTSRCV